MFKTEYLLVNCFTDEHDIGDIMTENEDGNSNTSHDVEYVRVIRVDRILIS